MNNENTIFLIKGSREQGRMRRQAGVPVSGTSGHTGRGAREHGLMGNQAVRAESTDTLEDRSGWQGPGTQAPGAQWKIGRVGKKEGVAENRDGWATSPEWQRTLRH